MALVFGFVTVLLQAFAKVLLKKSFDSFPSSVAFFLETVFGCIIWIPFALATDLDISKVSEIAPVVALSAILSEAYIFYIYSKGNISITVSIFSTYSIFTIIFSHLINSETLSSIEYCFIFLTILGTLVVSMPAKLSVAELKKAQYILWPLSGAMAVGISDTISKSTIDSTSAGTFLFTLAFMQIPVSIIFLKLEKQSVSQFIEIRNKAYRYKYSALSALLICISMITFWLTFTEIKASIASPLTATTPILVTILAKIILDEKLIGKNIIGICITTMGVIGVGIFSI